MYRAAECPRMVRCTIPDQFSAGDFIGNEQTEDIVFKDAASGVYKRIVLEENRIKGAVLYGDTLDDVRAHTKASASCGSCTGLVESLLAHTVGGDYSATPASKPLCKCTDSNHDEIRKGIVTQSLKTMQGVRDFFEWGTVDGCASCRNALNYYLLCAWPNEYVDDAQSRFINERAHGNIQKDGTYSVIPRMFGGMCTPQQLRAIADVADKYQVPEMKVTGGLGRAAGRAHLGFMDAAQIQDGGVGLSAQLCRGHHQGFWGGVCGFGL